RGAGRAAGAVGLEPATCATKGIGASSRSGSRTRGRRDRRVITVLNRRSTDEGTVNVALPASQGTVACPALPRFLRRSRVLRDRNRPEPRDSEVPARPAGHDRRNTRFCFARGGRGFAPGAGAV